MEAMHRVIVKTALKAHRSSREHGLTKLVARADNKAVSAWWGALGESSKTEKG